MPLAPELRALIKAGATFTLVASPEADERDALAMRIVWVNDGDDADDEDPICCEAIDREAQSESSQGEMFSFAELEAAESLDARTWRIKGEGDPRGSAVLYFDEPAQARPDDTLALWFDPASIRSHFDGEFDLSGVDDDRLREVAATALADDNLYRAFHDALVSALVKHNIDGR